MSGEAALLRVCGGALTALVCLLIIRASDKGGGMGNAAALGCSVLLCAGAFTAVFPVIEELRQLCGEYLADLPEDAGGILCRVMAAGMTVQLTGDLIRDAGEGGLADRLELAGRAVLLAMGFPIIRALLSLARSWMGA